MKLDLKTLNYGLSCKVYQQYKISLRIEIDIEKNIYIHYREFNVSSEYHTYHIVNNVSTLNLYLLLSKFLMLRFPNSNFETPKGRFEAAYIN